MKRLFLFAGFNLIGFVCFSFPQVDPFYLQAFEKAQKAFVAKDYPGAIRDFEIAAFGLALDKKLKARACVYLGLSYYYQKNMKASEKNLREAVELMGEDGYDSLEMPEDIWPDLTLLLGYFNIKPAGDETPAEAEKSQETRLEAGKNQKEIPPQKPAREPKQPLELKVNEIKEGDTIPLDLVDYPPLVIKQVEAIMPSWARSAGIKGTVIVNALISEKGRVIKTKILQGIKDAYGLDQAAARAVQKWEFDPATVKGVKVKVWMPIAIEFGKKD